MFEFFYLNVIQCIKMEYELRITGTLEIIESKGHCFQVTFDS
jgi:hypothetical protein